MNASPSVFMALKREMRPGEWTPSSFVTRMTGIKTIVAECEDSFIAPAIKYLKVVIPRLDRGIQKVLDTPIKSEYDMKGSSLSGLTGQSRTY